MSITVIHQPLTDTEWDKATAHAQNTPCDVAGCNGSEHEAGVAPAGWTHELVGEKFDGETVSASIRLTGGAVYGYMDYEASGEMTAADFRAEADTYEAFPAWLRSMADRMDALSETAAI